MTRESQTQPLVGIGYRKRYRGELLSPDLQGGPSVLEIIPDHFALDPQGLLSLSERYPLVFHDVGLSIGTVGAGGRAHEVIRARVHRVKTLIDIARPLFFSDHLAMTVSPSGVDLGHLAPIWHTESMLAHTIDRVRALQDLLGVPIALENIASPVVIPEGDMNEAEFFSRVVEQTECGLLLDVSNLLANGRNFGFAALDRVNDYPLSSVWQVHLAGGFSSHGFWVDSHDRDVEEASFALLRLVAANAPHLRVVVIERDERLPDLALLLKEVLRAREVLLS